MSVKIVSDEIKASVSRDPCSYSEPKIGLGPGCHQENGESSKAERENIVPFKSAASCAVMALMDEPKCAVK
jgi:hypothetical protein